MLVGQGGMVIHIDDVMGIGILPQPLVNVDDGLGGILDVGVPREGGARRDGADERHDVVGAGQLTHRHHVLYHFVRFHPNGGAVSGGVCAYGLLLGDGLCTFGNPLP